MSAAATITINPPRDTGKFSWPDKILLIIAGAAAAYVGVAIVAGLYHLLDIWQAFHRWWHGFVPDKATRNDVRDVWEALTAGYAAQLVTWNSIKWHAKGGGSWLDKIDRVIPFLNRFRAWVRRFPLSELGVSYLLSLPAAAIGFTAVYFITRAIPAWTYVVPVPGHHKALVLSSLIINHKAMGFAASYFFGRHMMRLAYDDVQYRLADRAARRSHNYLSWLSLPNFRVRVTALRYSSVKAQDQAHVLLASGHRRLQAAMLSLGMLVAVGLGFYGWLVLNYLAHGQPMPWGLR
jgi:hypothetical protein